MDVANELLDAIEIIADKKIRENTAQIYFGVCKGVNGDSCVMSINGKNNTIHFYGSAPIVGLTYRVFVPNGNMSMAFAITGNDDRKGLYYSNPNLLDNWYFGNPVNQRGQTSYTGVGCGIDRWLIGAGSNGTLSLTESWLNLARTDGVMYLVHRIPKTQIPEGSVLTYSVLTASGLFSISFIVKNDTYHEQVVGGGISLGWNYSSAEIMELTLVNNAVNSNVTVKAAKLELGSQQTLAHQDTDGNWVLNEIPDYGEQLARCQRYFQLYSSADNRPSKAVDCRPTMHTDPSQGTIIIDGTTYYYNTADL